MKAIKKEICKFVVLSSALLCMMLLGSAFEGLLPLLQVFGALCATVSFCVLSCSLLLGRGFLPVCTVSHAEARPRLRVARGGKMSGREIA